MNYLKTLAAGILATGVMTAFLCLGPYVGLPRMNMGEILGAMVGGNLVVGWTFHFIIGIAFTFIYAMFFNNRLPVESNFARGAIYGIFVFIVTQVLFTMINLAGLLRWEVKESMGLMVFGNALAFIIYGAVMGTFFKRQESLVHFSI